MGKKLSRELFEELATQPRDVGKLDEAKQKRALSKEDIAQLATIPVTTTPEPGVESHPETQYYKGYLQGSDYNKHLAMTQKWTDEMGNAAARVAYNFIPGILGSIGGIADIPDWFAGVNDQTEEVGNSLTRWANDQIQKTNQDRFPIYQKDPTPGIHLGSSEWWFDKGASVVDSALQFGALGFGLGSLITKGLASAKWLSAIDAATGATKLNAIGEAVGVGTNAFMLNQAESIMDATQTYDSELKLNMELVKQGKLTEHEAKVRAAQAAAHVVNIDRINILTNLTGVGAIMKGARGTRNIKNMLNGFQRSALEGGQEYLEESVNYYAQNRGTELGQALREGKEYTGVTVNKFIDDMTSAQGVEAGFLGALGGVGQAGITHAVQNIQGAFKDEKEHILEQQAYLKEFDNLRKENKLSNVTDLKSNIDEHNQLISQKQNLEKAIEEDVKNNVDPGEKVVALEETKYQILAAQAKRAFGLGTTDYLEKAYTDIAALTDEQAKNNGFTDEELNPKSNSYFKKTAERALSTIKTLEKAYLKTQHYINAPVLFQLKAKELRQEQLLNQGKQQLAEKGLEATQAINGLARKTIFAPGVSNIFSLEHLEEGEVNKEVDFSRKAILTKAKNLKPVQDYERLKENLSKMEDELDNTKEVYADQASDKVQDKLKEVKKKEIEQAAIIEKQIKSNIEKIKQAAIVKKDTDSKIVKAVNTTATIQDQESQEASAIHEEVQRIFEKSYIEKQPLTPEEETFKNANLHIYNELVNINEKFNKEKKESKEDNKPLPSQKDAPVTATEVGQILEESGKYSDTTIDNEIFNDNNPKGKLTQAHNVVAWLARAYKAITAPFKLKEFSDVDDKLNTAMKDPRILDNRFLKVGDKITLEIESGFVVIPGQEDQVPIVIKKGEDVIADLHIPDWITTDNTQGGQAAVDAEKRKLRDLRAEVIKKGKLETKISKRSYGKLFIASDKTPKPVSQMLKDNNLQYGIFYAGALTQSRVTKNIVNKNQILNRKVMKEGRAYVLLPVTHAVEGEAARYWAIPLIPQKLSEDLKRSALKAVEIFYKGDNMEKTGLTEEEKLIVKSIQDANKHIKQGDTPLNFDITNYEGLNNYLSLFLYSKHEKGAKSGDTAHTTLDSFLRSSGVTSDYHAMEVSPHGVFFGSGKFGTVSRLGKDLPTFLNAFKSYLDEVYTQADLDRFDSNAKVPVIDSNNKVNVLPGNTYQDFLKEHAWKTNVLGHDISQDPTKPNYQYAIQQIIEFETPKVDKIESKPEIETGVEVIDETGARTKLTEVSEEVNKKFEELAKKAGFKIPIPKPLNQAENLPLEILPEAIYSSLQSNYSIPGLTLAQQDSLINWVTSIINDKFEEAFKLNNSKHSYEWKPLLAQIKQVLEEAVKVEGIDTSFYDQVLKEWSKVTLLTKYTLENVFDYKFLYDELSSLEEASALNPWAVNTLEKDPGKSLTKRFKRFLATIQDPSSPSAMVDGEFDRINPNKLYKYISSLLSDTYPSFDVMIEKLEKHLQDLGEESKNTPLGEVINSLKNADEQIKNEFVVTASKHYVNMQHLYITKDFNNNNQSSGYNGYVRNDNAASKIAVTVDDWHTNLKLGTNLVIPANDAQGTLLFNKQEAGKLADEFLNQTEETWDKFDLNNWLKQIGITLHPGTFTHIKKQGLVISKRLKFDDYIDLLTSKSSPFRLLAVNLKSIAELEKPVAVINSGFIKDRVWQSLAKIDSEFSDVSHSHTHRSGDKYIFSYADNKYLTDRFKDLKEDINLLTSLADRGFSKSSWWLKELLQTTTSVTGDTVFKRTADGNVIINEGSTFQEKFKLNYVSLQAIKEKGLKTAKIKALEDLSVKDHEKAKMMFFQNTGERDAQGQRVGEFFMMTLSNKNTMLTVQSTVPSIKLDDTGTISEETVDLLFRNIVQPEIQRMLDYNDAHNINGYTEGYNLFYFFPEINNLDIWNLDGSLKKDVAITNKAEINEIIKQTIQVEVTEKLKQWNDFGFIDENKLNYIDLAYQGFIRSKLGSKATNEEIVNYAATEMSVGYMMINTNLFQLVSTDPATQWKSDTSKSKIDQVQDTFDNITKRLGGEISPGRDLAQDSTGDVYNLAVIQDVQVPSKVLDKLKAITGSDDYKKINSTDAVEFITLPEKLKFMRQSAKLTPEQIKLIPSIEKKYYAYQNAVYNKKDPSKYDLNLAELGVVLQVDKPIMVGTRVDNNVETKVFVKSAAFTMIPQLLRGTELAKLEELMYNHNVDRLAFASAVKLGAPKNIKQVFDKDGNFIEGSVLDQTLDMFPMDRRNLRLQQEVPIKDKLLISRVSQASKLLFVDILDKIGFSLPSQKNPYTAKELHTLYNEYWGELYKSAKDNLLNELNIDPMNPGNWTPDVTKLNKLIKTELIKRNYPPQDLEALGLENKNGKVQFKFPVWALSKSGKLEAFLNAIVDSRIVDQDMSGMSYVMASEVGFKFKKEAKLFTRLEDLKPELGSEIKFTANFDGELKPALANNGYHQVVVPWKYSAQLSNFLDKNGRIDSSKLDPEMLKAFGMRIPNQGPNSTAAIEIVGFLPPQAGDLIIAPADFVIQMGSDFDIDKLYVYLANYNTEKLKEGYLVKITDRSQGVKKYLQNQILNIHLSINTNLDKDIQKAICNPLESNTLKKIANEIADIESKKTTGIKLSPISSTYQANKYVNSTIASEAIGAFAVQNTFNALSQAANLKLVKRYPVKETDKVQYSKIQFGKDIFLGDKHFSTTKAFSGDTKSSQISALLSAAVDDEKLQILSKIGINRQTISMANLLLQAGFDLETISYFLKQDIIQEYTKQLDILGNPNAATEAVLKQDKFSKADPEFSKPITKQTGFETTTEEEENLITAKDSQWGELYNAGLDVLKEQFELGEQAPNYANQQYALLKKFVNLQNNEVKTLRTVQALVNTDTKGPGKSMFESITKEASFEKLLNSKLENVIDLFGDIKEPDFKASTIEEKEIKEKAWRDRLREQGYVDTEHYMFKPTTIPGFAMAYGVLTNNRIWSQHFPYSHPALTQVFKEIASNMSEKAENFTQEADRNSRLFAQVKNYVWTNNSITPQKINQVRRELLYDYKENNVEHQSLASIFQKLKTESEFTSNVFLNNLFVSSTGNENDPKVLLFKRPGDSEDENFKIYSQVIDSLKNPKGNWEFNGKTYNTRTFIEDLMLSTRISGTSSLQQDLLQFLPADYMVLNNTAEALHDYNWHTGMTEGRSNNEVVPALFTTQYFQHFPQLAPSTRDLDSICLPNPESVITEKPEGFENAPDQYFREIISFQLKPGAEIDLGREEQDYPKFIYDERKEKLYRLQDAETLTYNQISTLGAVNNHEYNSNNEVQTSNIKKNNPAVASKPVINKEYINPKEVSAGKKFTIENQEQSKLLAAYGLKPEEYTLTREELSILSSQVLKSVENSGDITSNGLAAFLSTAIGDREITVKSEKAFMPDGSEARGETRVKNGKVTVAINFSVITSPASLDITFLHEMVHAVTLDAIKNPKNNSQKEARGRLERLLKEYKDKYYAGKDFETLQAEHRGKPGWIELVYPTKNVEEFVVAIMTQPTFRGRLQTLAYDENHSFWSKLVKVFRSIIKSFGLDKDSTAAKAISDILRLTEDVKLNLKPSKSTAVITPSQTVPVAKELKQLSAAEIVKNSLISGNTLFTDEGEIIENLPMEDKDYSDPRSKYQELIKEKRTHIDQLRKRIQELNSQIRETTGVHEIAELKKRRDKIQDKIQDISGEISKAESAVKLEDLVPLAMEDLKNIETEIIKGTALDYKDIEILNRKVKLWKNYHDNFLNILEKESAVVNEMFKDVLTEATRLDKTLEGIKKQKVLHLAEAVIGKKLDANVFYEAITDISSIAAQTLSLDNHDHALLQAVFEYVKRTETFSKDELHDITDEMNELISKVKGKEDITGKNLEKLIDEDGTLIMPYTQEFLNTKYSFAEDARKYEEQGDHAKAIEAWKNFAKWVKENEQVFDIRKLKKIEGHEAIFEKDNGKHEKALRDLVGDAEFERKLKRAEKLYNNYLADKENAFGELEDLTAQKDWEDNNDVFQYLDYRQDPSNNKSNRGWQYIEKTPAAEKGWYNDKYKVLQADKDVAALHDYIVQLMVKLRRYLPEKVAREFNINSLPALQKNVLETLHTAGLSAAVSHMWDSAKNLVSSKDLGEELYSADPTKRSLNVNVKTLTQKIQALYNQKANDFLRVNNLEELPEGLSQQLLNEATAEVKQEHTLDLKSILGIYTAAVIDYRHKAKVEDAIRLAEEVFNNHIPAKVINGRAGNLENSKKMLANALDNFYKVPRTIEGVSKKKIYSNKENIRKEALEQELVKYKGELAAAEESGSEEDRVIAKNKISVVETELNKLGNVHTATGWADAILQYIMIKGLGWNPFSGLNNMGFGLISNMVESSAGNYFTESSLLKGYKYALNSVAKFWSFGSVGGDLALKIRTLMDNMDVLKKPSEEIYKSNTPITGIANSLHWSHIQNRTEYLNQAPVMVAMMLEHKLTKLDGTESNLWEAYGKQGKWDVDAFGSIKSVFPTSDKAKFNSRLSEAIRKIHGNYDPSAKILLKSDIKGRMLSIFRNWMFEGFNTRFEHESTHHITGKARKGRYRSYGGSSLAFVGGALGSVILTPGFGTAIGAGIGGILGHYVVKNTNRYKNEDISQFQELAEETKYLIRKLSLGLVFKKTNLEDVFNSVDAQNMRKNMTELSMLMFVMGIAMLLKGLKDDTDDEDLKAYLTYNLNVMHRLQQDVAFYAEPKSFYSILKDPIPATSTITDIFDLGTATLRYINDDDEIKTGRNAHKSRLGRAAAKTIPGVKQVINLQNSMDAEYNTTMTKKK